MEANDEAADIIRRLLAEADLDAEQVLAGLVRLLAHDHVSARAKAGATALNHPTTLWSVEKVIAERLMANSRQGKPHDPLLGTLAVLLVTCRERAEDQAKPAEDEPPKMRLVRD